MNVISVIITIVVAFGVTVGSGFVIIPWLKKLKFGQTILDIGPSWHKSKQGTPNMGGLMFIFGIIVSFIIGALTLHFRAAALSPNRQNLCRQGCCAFDCRSLPRARMRNCRFYG